MSSYQRIYANNAKTTLASPVSSSDTSIIVADASRFPVPAANQFFTVTFDTGSTIEIIDVYGISGNVFVNCVRAREGTAAQSFLTGTRVENRVTAQTLGSFARLIDRVADISSVDQLSTVATSSSNSYLCASTDDDGSPILAVKNGSFWRFPTHPTTFLSGSVISNGTQNTMPLTNASSTLPLVTAGTYLIQFKTGNNAGLARIITATNSTTVSWVAPLPYSVATSDQYEVYISTANSLSTLRSSSDDGLIFSILFGD